MSKGLHFKDRHDKSFEEMLIPSDFLYDWIDANLH